MSPITEADFNVWKAKAISRGKLLERFRDRLQEIVDHVENEGDRVYFGSTNHLDHLKEIADEMDMWKWDRIIKERPEVDPYAELRRVRSGIREAVKSLDGQPEYHDQGMGCGLEDRGITDRYAAMHHGWEQAMERVYGENIAWAKDALTSVLSKQESTDV